MYFSDADIATDKLIRAELANIGVTVAEHYVISGADYSGFRPNFYLGSPESTPELEKFYESIPKDLGGYYEH